MLASGNSTSVPVKCKLSMRFCSSLVELAGQQGGYRGVLALCSGKSESPDVTLVALWDSLEAIRVSENNLFLTHAIARYRACC
jgi:hypothetical protein